MKPHLLYRVSSIILFNQYINIIHNSEFKWSERGFPFIVKFSTSKQIYCMCWCIIVPLKGIGSWNQNPDFILFIYLIWLLWWILEFFLSAIIKKIKSVDHMSTLRKRKSSPQLVTFCWSLERWKTYQEYIWALLFYTFTWWDFIWLI